MPKQNAGQGKAGRKNESGVNQVTFRPGGRGPRIREHRKARELRSDAAVIKEALDLYFALDLPSPLIKRIVAYSEFKQRPLGEVLDHFLEKGLEADSEAGGDDPNKRP